MNLNLRFHRCCILFCHAAILCIFLAGFLPIQRKTTEFAIEETHLPRKLNNIELNSSVLYTPKLTKLVLIVIDALRADFIFGKYFKFMPFLQQLHQKGKACSYLGQAHTPTVTLPRIKALVTGSVPGFSDVIFNLGIEKLEEDNLVDQLIKNGHKIVFYGDDTWLKLFPNKFIRSEGTTSFFVNDFYEVDENVTRHLDYELVQTDWSVMILHYLGLDHIGHVKGPKSSLVPEKLTEMDDVIKKIYSNLNNERTGIVICGDHGMSDLGSHGGSSKAEVEIPLTFLLEGCQPDFKTKLQIDLAPTLSVLMGVPIPVNNLGSIILSAIDRFQLSHKLYATFTNAQSIVANLPSNNFDDYNYQLAVKLYQDWLTSNDTKNGEKVADLFSTATSKMSSQIIERLANFDSYLMVIAIFLSLQVLIIHSEEAGILATSPRIFSVSSLMLCIIFVSIPCHVLVCFSIGSNSSLCLGNEKTSFIYTIGINFTIFMLIFYVCHSMLSRKIRWRKPFRNLAEIFLLFGSLMHAVSLGASSLVEEEHQTYYFLVNTFALLLLNLNKQHKEGIFSVIGFMGLLRIARCWNQTGDKWRNEPDVQGWLNDSTNKSYLTIMSMVGAAGIFWWIKLKLKLNRLQLVASAVGLCAILAHRAASGIFSVSFLSSMGIPEAAVAYGSLLVIALSSRDRSSPSIAAWIILTSLLKRPHNLFLTLLNLIQYSLIRPLLVSALQPFYYGLAHYWIGMVWYFQQGNGNNLARIDVASGYVGLSDYNVFAVGALLSCATFSGPALALLLCLQESAGKSRVYGFIWSRHLIVTLFLIIITSLRYHLFIWTVFSPKLLYEGALSLFLSIALFLVHWD